MSQQDRFEFFEKLYFHELEAREQMTTRLQIPLVLLISTIGALGFMIQNLDRDLTGWWVYAFVAALFLTTAFVLLSGYFCVQSAWGHEYQMTSFSTEWKEYHDSCVMTYQGEPEATREKLIDEAFKETVQTKYIECASNNAAINADRAFKFHLTIKYFLWAIGFTSLTFACYFFGSLDKSVRSKPTEVSIVSAAPLKGITMTTKPSPPPPPPPPPTRFVRDDRPSTPPPAPKNNGK